jgi:hypothetical protein
LSYIIEDEASTKVLSGDVLIGSCAWDSSISKRDKTVRRFKWVMMLPGGSVGVRNGHVETLDEGIEAIKAAFNSWCRKSDLKEFLS